MYFAQMFCYGFHNDCAGITGISSCMGVIFLGDRPLYAIHIPYSGLKTERERAATVFASFVKRTEPNPKNGQLFLLTNGTTRSTAEEEAQDIRTKLGNPATTLYRIMKHNKKTDNVQGIRGDTKSVAVMMKHTITGLVKVYKHVPEPANWKVGGKPSVGKYKGQDTTEILRETVVPKDNELQTGWHDLSWWNCKVTNIK